MAIPLTQDEIDDIEMSKSVMDEPRSGFQTLKDFLFGRTLPEQMNQIQPTMLSTPIAKVAPQVADPTIVNRAIRAMGREAMNYMRKTGQMVDVVPLPRGKTLGSFLKGNQKHLAGLAPNASEATARHELTGHMFEEMLPRLTKEELQHTQQGIVTPMHKQLLRLSGYENKEIPGEAFAYAREVGAEGAAPLSQAEVARGTAAARQTRKNLKEIMRTAFEDEPAEAAAPATPRSRKAITDEALAEVAQRNKEEAASGFGALMAKQPQDVQQQALQERLNVIINRTKKATEALRGGD